METSPSVTLAQSTLPPPLYQALLHFFGQGVDGCMLVGGTAFAGYYAGHRRSDDLDLFTDSESSFTASVLAVRSLVEMGAEVDVKQRSRQYARFLCTLDSLMFTVDVVLDPRLFEVGRGVRADDGVSVADLNTLLITKSAALVSRCSEKDLYDLLWLLGSDSKFGVGDLIVLGQKIDGGVNGEAMLLSVSGTKLRKDACDFSIDPAVPAKKVYSEITQFQEKLVRALQQYLEQQEPGPLKDLVDRIRRLKGN